MNMPAPLISSFVSCLPRQATATASSANRRSGIQSLAMWWLRERETCTGSQVVPSVCTRTITLPSGPTWPAPFFRRSEIVLVEGFRFGSTTR